MDTILSWPPLMWATRIVALLMVGGVATVVIALLVRLLSPSNLRGLAHGDLPAIRKGRFSVMGQELEVSTVAESSRDEQAVALQMQVGDAVDSIDELAMLVRLLLADESRRRDERIQHGPESPPPDAGC